MKLVIPFLLILNLLNIKQVLQEILIILVLVKKVMKQIKLVKMKLKLLLEKFKYSFNNYEIELILTWSKNCVLVDMTRRNAQGNNPAIVPPAELEFKTKDTKLYVPVVRLSKENDIKLRTIKIRI